MKVKKPASHIPVPSSTFFCVHPPLSSPLCSFTDLLQTQLSIGDRVLGIGPSGEDLGFISYLCSPLVICIKFGDICYKAQEAFLTEW